MIRFIFRGTAILVLAGIFSASTARAEEADSLIALDASSDPPLLAQAVVADSLIASARAAGRAGKPRQAIERYELAFTVAPERRDEISAALAFQYAWAGDLGLASEEFRRARTSNPWDYDLRMGELLVTNWMGDHLAAWNGYSQMVMDHSERTGPWIGLATAQNWSGRPDLALETLDFAKQVDPDNQDAARLEGSIRAQLEPSGGAFYDWSKDSEDYQVNSLWLEGGFSPNPRTKLIPFVSLVGIRQPIAPDIDETWLGLTVTARPATRLGLWSRLGVLTNREDGATYSPLVFSLTGDWAFSDRIRAGASLDHFAVVSFVTFPEKITGNTFGVFAEGRPDWLTRVRGTLNFASYAPVAGFEENHRWNFSAVGTRQVWGPARLRTGLSARYIDFEMFQDNGIWTPDTWWALAGIVEWDWGVRDLWSFNGSVELGPARESGGETTLFASYRFGVYRAFGPNLLEFSVGQTEGNLETWTGYDRTFAHLGFRRRF